MSDQITPDFDPPQALPRPEGPVMSTGETLTGIFFEPGKTFASFRVQPKFLVALLISIVAVMIFYISFTQRIGFERIQREAIEQNPRSEQLTKDQREQQIKMTSGPIVKAITYAVVPIAVVLITGLGAAIYLLGAAMMGGQMNYWQALSVWTYSSLPPILIATVLNMVLMFIMSPDTYDIVRAQRRGLVNANLTFLVNAKASPQLFTVLGALDLLAFYGLFLAAVGLRRAGKLSSGAAWGIVLVLFLIGVASRLAFSFAFGSM